MSGDADAEDRGYEQLERVGVECHRRDFLRNLGVGTAYLAFLAGGLEFLEACGGGSTTTTVNVKEGGHVVESSVSDLKNFNAVLTTDYTSDQMISMINDGLYTIDATGNLYPLLAKEKPQISSDNLRHTIPLRQGVNWSDCQHLTADDGVFPYS